MKHKFKGTDREWEAILCYFLLQKHPEEGHARIFDNVRMIYTLKKDNLEVSIQQDVRGIKVGMHRALDDAELNLVGHFG